MLDLEPFSFDDIAKAAFSTSASADELNTTFAGSNRLSLRGRFVAARLALARSLSVPEAPETCDDGAGKVIKGSALFGDNVDARTWVSLLIEHGPTDGATVGDVQDLVRRHWARGVRLLEDDWNACEGDHDRFILRLAQQAGLRGEGEFQPRKKRAGPDATFTPRAVPVRLPLGPLSVDASSGKPVAFGVNAKGSSPHIAIMGTLGTGKTIVARKMLEAAYEQCGCPVLLFDMGKGDLASDAAFVQRIGAQVLEPPKKPIPLDVLHTGDSDDMSVKTALRFRESFARVPQASRLGDIQIACVGDAVERALRGARPVKLSDVHGRLKEVYAEKRRRDDLAITTFDDVAKFKLFDPQMSPAAFFSQSWVIDVHDLPEFAQRLVVFLLLDAAAAYFSGLPDSGLDAEHNRALRLIVAIDEARKVLDYEQESLIELVRTSRSKGGVVMMISQSPDDFAGNDENFLENLGIGICFRTNAKPSALATMLGQQVDLAGLPNGVCVTRLVDRGLVRVKAWEERAG